MVSNCFARATKLQRCPIEPLTKKPFKRFSSKTGKDSFEVNIRVLVSTPKEKKDNAQRILYQISGAFEQFSTPKLNRLSMVETKGGALDSSCI